MQFLILFLRGSSLWLLFQSGRRRLALCGPFTVLKWLVLQSCAALNQLRRLTAEAELHMVSEVHRACDTSLRAHAETKLGFELADLDFLAACSQKLRKNAQNSTSASNFKRYNALIASCWVFCRMQAKTYRPDNTYSFKKSFKSV